MHINAIHKSFNILNLLYGYILYIQIYNKICIYVKELRKLLFLQNIFIKLLKNKSALMFTICKERIPNKI